MYLSTEHLSPEHLSTEKHGPSLLHEELPVYSVESIFEKGSADLNEDIILQDGNVFGVFDGATSLYHDDLPAGVTGGRIAAQTAADSFRLGTGDLVSRAEHANREIGAAAGQDRLAGAAKFRRWCTSAAVVSLEDGFFDYCQIGDSLIMVVRNDGSSSLLTPDTAHDRETLRLWKNSRAPAGAAIHEFLSGQILAVRSEMNVTYGVLNGEPEAMRFLQYGRESLDDVSAILLFTDGLFLPKEDPDQASDWSLFADLYREGGLHAVHERVRSLEQTDPDCRQYPRFKRHDDIAAIAVSF